MLLIDGDMRLLGASDSFYRNFAIAPGDTIGRFVFELDRGHWDSPRLRSMLAAAVASGTIDDYELDLRTRTQGIRRLVLKAQQLAYAGSDGVRILLSVADVTEARLAERLKDDLIREKAVLLQELQHRVANSLQIIASVLMQSARTTSSDETRGHLRDAHNRVMSIASVQKQLAVGDGGDVALRPYLTQLCSSIGASMIVDGDAMTLDVRSDDCSVAPNVSVSLGLIVTELVINALKHAFPETTHGHITVDYAARGDDWTLTVGDDGVGMPAAPKATSGLGTSIVLALARQLQAQIRVSPANPGTTVAVAHTRLQAVADAANDEEPIEDAV